MFFLLSVITPKAATALTRVVVTDTTECPSDTVNSPCYTSLSEAITNALDGDAIEIHPGVYTGNFTINKKITSIYGTETARTFLSAGGSGAVLTITNVTTSISVKRLSFVNAATGILVQNSQSVGIANNVFEVGPTNTAIQLNVSPSAVISNNSFYQNSNGILSDSTNVNIKNNIFSSQLTTAIGSNVDILGILHNLFFNSVIGPAAISFDPADTANYKGNLKDQDPKFVTVSSADAAQRDFHLEAGSPCIDTGDTSVGTDSVDLTTADIGAYGGPNSDTIPFPVSGVAASTPSATTISISWNPNNGYTVTGYKVYYGTSPRSSKLYDGTGAAEGNSPITVPTGTAATSFALSGLATAVTPSTPTLLSTSPLNEGLVLNWSAAQGATSYKVYYGTTSPPTTSINVGSVTSYKLSGLTNGQTYYVRVSAVAENTYYIAVTAFDSIGSASGSPGVSHESAYSQEVFAGSGNAMESKLSDIIPDFPEALVPYPNLPNSNQGCFIATAAYGHYSAPQVQALRDFRDQYLLAISPGRAFVRWYYTYGPTAAAWLDAHPGYKPAVRAALLPAVGLSMFMTRTSPILRTGFVLSVVCVLILIYYRRRISGSGGSR